MKKVIYTCITNKYDTLKEPTIITPEWDYVCFYDVLPNKEKDSVWKLIQIPSHIDSCKLQREIKINSFYIFESYDLSIWVDGSIRINCNLNNFVEVHLKTDLATMQHPSRNCIYQEASACITLNKDTKETIKKQTDKYLLERFPLGQGMVATGIIIKKHTKQVKDFCMLWWDEVNNHSKRDQLSFNYINWKNPINYTTFSYMTLYREFLISKHN